MTPLLQTQYLQTFLASIGPFFHGKPESINKNLPSLVSVLRSVGVGERWQNISWTTFSIYVRWFRPPQARSCTPLTKKPLHFQFFFQMFWWNSVNFSHQQNWFNRFGYRFLWLNRRFPVISGFIWFFDFVAYPDRTAYRFTVQPAGPIRFLKPWSGARLVTDA